MGVPPTGSGAVHETVARFVSTVACRAAGADGGSGRSSARSCPLYKACLPIVVSSVHSSWYEVPGTIPGNFTVGLVESVVTRTVFHAGPV